MTIVFTGILERSDIGRNSWTKRKFKSGTRDNGWIFRRVIRMVCINAERHSYLVFDKINSYFRALKELENEADYYSSAVDDAMYIICPVCLLGELSHENNKMKCRCGLQLVKVIPILRPWFRLFFIFQSWFWRRSKRISFFVRENIFIASN